MAVTVSTVCLSIPKLEATPQYIIMSTSLFALAGVVSAWRIREPPAEVAVSWRSLVRSFSIDRVIDEVGTLVTWLGLPALYLFTRGLIPNSSVAFNSFLYSTQGLPPAFLSGLRFMGPLAGATAIFIYWVSFKNDTNMKVVVGVTSLASMFVGMLQLLVTEFWKLEAWWLMCVVVPVEFLLFMDVRLAYQPIIILVTKLCPPSLGAFTFASLFSVENIGNTLSGFISAGMAEHYNVGASNGWSTLWKLILFCELCKLIPLLLLPCMELKQPCSNQEVMVEKDDDDDEGELEEGQSYNELDGEESIKRRRTAPIPSHHKIQPSR
eukprot:GHVN01034041.1.p1 GENE.GHVN01034041.1~~GHVN01034041.1.p1  ORF type:complete len:323 (-),score=31.77 GHVN01034041.1:570-1538(-)